jgi:Flp pilus assembly protein TadB
MNLICSVVAICAALAGLGAIAWYLDRVRRQARLALRHEAEAEHNTHLRLQQRVAEERVRAAEQSARRKAMDEFLSDIHAEERAYLRQRELGGSRTRSAVVEERLYFRNLPVSNWSQQELTFYTASGPRQVARMIP